MTAVYPGALKTSFGNPRVDLQSVVVADDVNPLYEEVIAIEKHVGADINKRKENWGVGAFSNTATVWTNLRDRVENVENGVSTSVQTTGGNTITNGTNAAGVSVTGASLTIAQASGQTSNLLEFKNSSSNTVGYISGAGLLQVVAIDGGSAASSDALGA